MEEKGVSRPNVTRRVGPELWWTRLKLLTKVPGFDRLLDERLQRMKIAN